MARRLAAKLSYANVTASVALFVALGGTSYAALALPRDSVGSAQIRRNAVSSTELRSRSVSSRHVRDRALGLRNISTSARRSLRGATGPIGPQGPQGPPGSAAIALRAAISKAGGLVSGNARSAGLVAIGEYRVTFDRDIGSCTYVASLATVTTDGTVEIPPPGRITVAGSGRDVTVKTFDRNGDQASAPFHLIVAC